MRSEGWTLLYPMPGESFAWKTRASHFLVLKKHHAKFRLTGKRIRVTKNNQYDSNCWILTHFSDGFVQEIGEKNRQKNHRHPVAHHYFTLPRHSRHNTVWPNTTGGPVPGTRDPENSRQQVRSLNIRILHCQRCRRNSITIEYHLGLFRK